MTYETDPFKPLTEWPHANGTVTPSHPRDLARIAELENALHYIAEQATALGGTSPTYWAQLARAALAKGATPSQESLEEWAKKIAAKMTGTHRENEHE